jgi:HAD superfamily hydrolase (TIGR01490 family)
MSLVLFDFDGTVTKLDTTLEFASFISAQHPGRGRRLLVAGALILARLRLLSNTALKRVFARLFLQGRTHDEIRQIADRYIRTRLDAVVDAKILGLLRDHLNRGDQIYLVSANFDCLLEALARHWSLAGVIATRAASQQGIYTGGIVGAACHGYEKRQQVIARFGGEAVAQSVAYGNQDDAPLLRCSGTGYLVRRASPPDRIGRMLRWIRLLTGQMNADDLAAAVVIERLPGPVRIGPPTRG